MEILLAYNGVSWSVSVEAFLYLCFPLLVLLFFKRATKVWHLYLIGFVAFSAIFLLATLLNIHGLTAITGRWLTTLPLARLGDFILGCVAARLYTLHAAKPVSPREHTVGVTLLLLSIGAVMLLMTSNDPFLFPYQLDSGYSLFFVFIIYALARYTTPLSKFLSTKLLMLLGEASYAFYLLHVMFIFHGLNSTAITEQLGENLYTILELLFIIVVSLGAYTYVETPLRKKIRQVFASRAPAPSSGPPTPTAVSS